jgi:hypothetical protein
VGLEKWPGGDAGLGKQSAEPKSLSLGHECVEQQSPDSTPLVVRRDIYAVDVAIPLQLREPNRVTIFLGYRNESPGEPPEPSDRVDVVGRPGRDLCWGIVSAVDTADGVAEQSEECEGIV